MFYINKNIIFRKREVFFLQILPTVIIFVAFVVITLLSWKTAKNSIKNEQIKSLQQQNNNAVSDITQKIEAYQDILRGGAGLFRASDTVTRHEWKEYLATYRITTRYPGIVSVGYSPVIPSMSLMKHEASIRDEGYPSYSVSPDKNRPLYSPVTYIEPFTGDNINAFGYDMYSHHTNHAAMDSARDTGSPVISTPSTLIQDENIKEKPLGFVMYLPLYDKKKTPSNISQRRSSLEGYVFAQFRVNDFINKTITNQNDFYGFQITDITNDSEQLIYQSDNYATLKNTRSSQQVNNDIILPGVTWKITGVVAPETINRDTRERANSVLWGGFLFSFFVAGFIYLLLLNRARSLAEKEERGIQEAKEELLALASHQLRTPATGVKQYIGMLREGFAGKVTPTQQKLLNKAYESNERQLGTINEMLFVARADAGHLNMDMRVINLSELVRDVVDEQMQAFITHKQKLQVMLPKKNVNVIGDRQYLRMAIENIISNATKYTKDKGRISIKLTADNSTVRFKVTDNGVGVSYEDQTLLFQKFSRIPNELTGQVSGSGMGLYLSKKIIDAHSGEIRFESGQGYGSTVIVELPIKVTKKDHRK